MIKKFVCVFVMCLSVFAVACSSSDPTTVDSSDLSTYVATLASLNSDSIQITNDSADDVVFSSSAATTYSGSWGGTGLYASSIAYNIAEAAGTDTANGIAGVVVSCDGVGIISSTGGLDGDGVYTFTLTVVPSAGYSISSSATQTATLVLTVNSGTAS